MVLSRLQKRLDVLFRITHSGTFNVSVQALMLIMHICVAKEVFSASNSSCPPSRSQCVFSRVLRFLGRIGSILPNPIRIASRPAARTLVKAEHVPQLAVQGDQAGPVSLAGHGVRETPHPGSRVSPTAVRLWRIVFARRSMCCCARQTFSFFFF
jgi:hypothetical protein